MKQPEILSPAGDHECMRAAIENGANAIYFGLERGFNARARATNFSLESLPETMAELHQHGVKGYVTFNTLVFSDELAEAEEALAAIAESGVDAILVQDLGLARLARTVCDQLPLHASTQMTLTSAECIEVAAELGIERVVLPREASIDEIRQIHAATPMELEAFVHGALCVAYSGQCLTSESLGGRSANRGQCAQACRLPYDLICDGRDVDLGEVKYLLSPQDLAAIDLLPELLDAGVCSFKIEGRLKTPEYVANVTGHYRRMLDEILAGRNPQPTAEELEEMELSFSRGFSPGWLQGCDHKMLVPGLSSAKRGVRIGRIVAIRPDKIEVELCGAVAAGDGIVFAGNRELGEEEGGRIFSLERAGELLTGRIDRGRVTLNMVRDRIDHEVLYVGQEVWKTDDPALTKRLRRTFSGRSNRKRLVQVTVQATEGRPLLVTAETDGVVWSGQTSEPLPTAEKHVVDEVYLRKQLGRLGNTTFELSEIDLQVAGRPMVPASWLGAIRREMAEGLRRLIVDAAPRNIRQGALQQLRQSHDRTEADSSAAVAQRAGNATQLRVLCRSMAQLKQLVELKVTDLIADFADIRQYGEAARLAEQQRVSLLIAPPRIQKPDEFGILRVMKKHVGEHVGVLARNLATLRYFHAAGVTVDADFSLNAANDLTVQVLRGWGARRVTASYDLNREQLQELLRCTAAPAVEVVIHQHMPMFHMEHCVYCAVLSPGTNKTNCGRPCDDHLVQLRDRVGMEHPLTADVGCRNTLFNATPQSGAEVVPQLSALSVKHFRVELLWEPAVEIERIVRLYRQLLAGEVEGGEVWAQLRASNRVGVTRGTLEERRDPLAIL